MHGGTLDDEVDDLALDEDDNPRIHRQAPVAECHHGAEGDGAVHDDDQRTEGNVGVFIQNHRDDIRASGSGACLEYHTDTDTVHDTAEDGGKELLFQQRTRLHALFDEGGDIDFRLQEGIIAVGIVDEPHENRNGESTDDGLHAEHPAEKIDAEQQQRHVHA